MIALAHRGLWWPDPAARNTPRAFEAAVRAGFGLELDLRPSPTGIEPYLVIQHGPRDPWFSLTGDSDLLGAILVAALQDRPLLAWNIKALGCGPALAAFLERHGLGARSVVFDQELADPARAIAETEALAGCGLRVLRRASDLPGEELPIALGNRHAAGVWLDCVIRDWVTAETLATCRATGKAAYVVSPELHGRPLDLALWRAWADADGVCTDYPHLLAALDAQEGPLQPVAPWWGP